MNRLQHPNSATNMQLKATPSLKQQRSMIARLDATGMYLHFLEFHENELEKKQNSKLTLLHL